MEFSCQRSALTEAFLLAASAAPTRSPKEVLVNVKVVCDETGLTLHGTDMEIGVRTRVDSGFVEARNGGAALLPLSRTTAILRESTDETLAIESKDSGVTIRGSKSKFKFRSMNPDEFPSMKETDDQGRSVSVSAVGLATALTRTGYAVDVTSSRFALGGLKFQTTDGGVTVVGTDGRRVATQVVAIMLDGTGDQDLSIIVPSRAVSLLQRALPKTGSIRLQPTANDIRIELGGSMFYSRLMDGRYPTWQKVIPDCAAWELACIPADALHHAVRQAAIVSTHESHGVTLTFSNGNLCIEAHTTEVGDSKIELPVPYEGDKEIALTVDHRYLSDICKSMEPGKVVTARFKDGESPLVFTADDGYCTVVMPMAIDTKR